MSGGESQNPSVGSITQYIGGLREGDNIATQEVWNRYFRRLIGLARNRLRDAPKRMADEEDVVVSAFESFYRGVEDGKFPKLNDREDLWQVLVMITARKAVNQLKHEFRQKRGAGKVKQLDGSPDDSNAGYREVIGDEPTPSFAMAVAEQCDELLDQLQDETLQNVAVWKMQGDTNDQIAERLGCKTRTVERKLKMIRELWSEEE